MSEKAPSILHCRHCPDPRGKPPGAVSRFCPSPHAPWTPSPARKTFRTKRTPGAGSRQRPGLQPSRAGPAAPLRPGVGVSGQPGLHTEGRRFRRGWRFSRHPGAGPARPLGSGAQPTGGGKQTEAAPRAEAARPAQVSAGPGPLTLPSQAQPDPRGKAQVPPRLFRWRRPAPAIPAAEPISRQLRPRASLPPPDHGPAASPRSGTRGEDPTLTEPPPPRMLPLPPRPHAPRPPAHDPEVPPPRFRPAAHGGSRPRAPRWVPSAAPGARPA